jgi:UDP-2,3-diacylglucosamine pyrophosphatase LpxH
MNSIAKEVFIISDLHIGGEYSDIKGGRGFRINTHVADLCKFFVEIRERAKDTKMSTELVINGDFLDFLAEKVPQELKRKSFIDDQEKALATFEQIVKRDKAVFDELNKLLDAGVSVTVLLGNHDIELSLPAIRDQLGTLLRLDSGRKFKFIYDGEAYLIGDVLIEHGNRYDGWNVVDHDLLRRFRSESSRRLSISHDADFSPPAGSELVELIMNPIKKDYPFIDLLKPETDAAIPFLLALEPSYANAANAIEAGRLALKAKWRGQKEPARPRQPGNFAGQVDSPLNKVLNLQLEDPSEREKLRQLIKTAQEGKQNMSSGVANRILSFAQLINSNNYEERLHILRGTLRCLQRDKSFDLSIESGKEYIAAAQKLASNTGISTIVFGHTHLAKEVEIADGKKYINTGTWADLMAFPKESIQGSDTSSMEAIKQFAEAIRAKQFDDYIVFHPTFAFIRFNEFGVSVITELKKYSPLSVLGL